jgi:hypothetical protein
MRLVHENETKLECLKARSGKRIEMLELIRR